MGSMVHLKVNASRIVISIQSFQELSPSKWQDVLTMIGAHCSLRDVNSEMFSILSLGAYHCFQGGPSITDIH